jgi:phospholipase C
MTIQDEIFRVTGLQVNDGLAVHFAKTDTESLQDAEHRWLIEQGATAGQINDMWIEAFGAGQINDVKLAYWKTQ